MRSGLPVLVLMVLAMASSLLAEDAPEGTGPVLDEAGFREQVTPFVNRYCVKCHGQEKTKADLNLAEFQDAKAVVEARKSWETVLEYISTGQMPPLDQEQPSDEESRRVANWIEAALTSSACQGPADPGRVTLRRLNRAEYNNTIRDLVRIDFQPADDFPTDDVGYGFDNIGDVLSVSPILLEKYLAAAEQVATRAIVVDRVKTGETWTRTGRRWPKDVGGYEHGDGRMLTSHGEVAIEHEFDIDGDYYLRVKAAGEQAGPEPVRMEIRLDGKTLKTVEVLADEGSPEEYELRVAIPKGTSRIAAAFVNDFYEEGVGDRNLIVESIAVQGPIEPDLDPLPESHSRIIFRTPKGPEDIDACAREIVERFARRAFRRPVRPEEVGRLVGFVHLAMDQGENFAGGIRLALVATLTSPHFLFKVEVDRGAAKPGEPEPLNNYELATRLSYFLWSSMPDDELFDLAAAGKLQKPEVLAAQAKRMLADPKAKALVENFAGQWLQIRNLATVTPSTETFPDFDDELRSAMKTETEMFAASIFAEDRSLLDFIDADYTFLNERLAKHYGIEGVTGEEFRRVSFNGDRRGGILAQASILTITSNPNRTSPVKRGKWILEQILGTPPPPPPPDVPDLSESQEAIESGSLRERLEQHRSNPSCASCHERMDPLGFGLENYNAVGGWRDKDGAFDIDASGTLPSGATFNGPRELKAILKDKRDTFARCLSEKLLTYALGRGLEAEDDCEVDRIVEALASDGYRSGRLVREVVTSVPFRMRKARGED